MDIQELLNKQKEFFYSGATRAISDRENALRKLSDGIRAQEKELCEALTADLGKSSYESVLSEISMVQEEIKHMLKYGRKYAEPRKCKSAIGQIPSQTYTVCEPYGTVLIMSPWNYPFLLTMDPLVDALMAGNTAIIKPSRYSAHSSAAIKKLIEFCFPSEYVAVVEGGAEVNQDLLNHKFDYIFFTGSKNVGRVVMEKAAAFLTPVTLELGGKSPCIVDETADLKTAANRIVFGKFLNCGQTCVAPDYILVHESVQDALIKQLKKAIERQLGKKPLEEKDYGKIINQKHFDRLKGLMEGQEIVYGGTLKEETLQIEPTLMKNVGLDSAIMQEEIFGPLLPIITYSDLEQVVDIVRAGEKPLALYYFSRDGRRMFYIQNNLSYGSGCFNDTVIQISSARMPFGGVGESGMGSYHGEWGFKTFSHEKSIVKKTSKFDVSIRFRPYTEKKEKNMRKWLG